MHQTSREDGFILIQLFDKAYAWSVCASGPAGFPLVDNAWLKGVWNAKLGRENANKPSPSKQPNQKKKNAKHTTPFAAQIPVKQLGPDLVPLEESDYQHVMTYTSGHKFELKLSASQVRELVTLMIERTREANNSVEDEEEEEDGMPAVKGPRAGKPCEHFLKGLCKNARKGGKRCAWTHNGDPSKILCKLPKKASGVCQNGVNCLYKHE